MNQQQPVNKMAVVPVNKLMLSLGIPMILSMMLQAVYNIVDSAFVSNMAENGETALNALLAKNLGMGDRERVNKVAGNSIFLGAVIYIVFLLFGILGVKAYISSQTSNPLIKDMAIDYLSICCILSMGIVFFSIFEKLLQATGNSLYSTIAQIIGAVVNVILDPILIYGWLGMPELGVKGAAYATVIGQIAACVTGLIFHLKVNKEVKNGLKYMKPSGMIIKGIYAIGLPAIIAQALMSVMTYALNIIFGKIDENVVTAYGLYYKIQQFILFAAFGLRDAITPIVSFNHGMGSKSRVKAGIKYGMMYTLVIMAVGLAVLEIFAEPFSKIFGLSGQTEELCVQAIRIVSLSFLFAGANVAFQGIFQALDSGLFSLVISILRQFLFVVPVAYVFSLIAIKNMDMMWLVWLTFFIAEGLSCLVACVFMKQINKKKVGVLKG